MIYVYMCVGGGRGRIKTIYVYMCVWGGGGRGRIKTIYVYMWGGGEGGESKRFMVSAEYDNLKVPVNCQCLLFKNYRFTPIFTDS